MQAKKHCLDSACPLKTWAWASWQILPILGRQQSAGSTPASARELPASHGWTYSLWGTEKLPDCHCERSGQEANLLTSWREIPHVH